MYDVLEQFIDFFQLDGLLDGSISSVSGFLGITILAFFGLIFTVIGIRIVFELVKILTDWSRFK